MRTRRPSRPPARDPLDLDVASVNVWSRRLGIGTRPLSNAIRSGELSAARLPGVGDAKSNRSARQDRIHEVTGGMA
jgi:hypothetical protein